MSPENISDDLEKLLELLPQSVQSALSKPSCHQDLLEIVLDLGRLPEARFTNQVITIGDQHLSRKEIKEIVNRLGKFGADNRAGIERTLHRISAIRNRQQEVIGLTCRVGRAVFGTVEMIRDLIEGGQSLLLMGRPGIGKTTALREIARVMADDLQRRVVIIDTSNEIAGDGDIPHPAIGRARRMQVTRPEHQHQVMIEAVENHMPEVIIIDEIGTELETHAARTIAERGVQLVATAHGNAIENLIKNPTLSDLVGGIHSVTLGDDEARRRRTQKTVLERASEPTFPVAVEINSRSLWSIHQDVASTVDLLLRGQPPLAEERKLKLDKKESLFNSTQNNSSSQNAVPIKPPIYPVLRDSPNSSPNDKDHSTALNKNTNLTKPLHLLCCGISQKLVEVAIRRHNWPVRWVVHLNDADVILSIRNGLGQNQILRKNAKEAQIPIHVIKSDTLPQIERAITRLISRNQEISTAPQACNSNKPNRKDEFAPLKEGKIDMGKIVVPHRQP